MGYKSRGLYTIGVCLRDCLRSNSTECRDCIRFSKYIATKAEGAVEEKRYGETGDEGQLPAR